MHHASCLCGAVTFEVTGDLPCGDGCHCVNCRKSTGHFLASVDLPRNRVTITGEDNVTWYHSSEKVRRGFFKKCGATLFFDPLFQDWIGLSLGAFDGPTNTTLNLYTYTAQKGDYYELEDHIEQHLEPPVG